MAHRLQAHIHNQGLKGHCRTDSHQRGAAAASDVASGTRPNGCLHSRFCSWASDYHVLWLRCSHGMQEKVPHDALQLVPVPAPLGTSVAHRHASRYSHARQAACWWCARTACVISHRPPPRRLGWPSTSLPRSSPPCPCAMRCVLLFLVLCDRFLCVHYCI